jgi:hypothetical protein
VRFAWQDLAAAVWFVGVLLSHQLAGIWAVPVNLDFMARLFLICVASWCWVFERPVPALGYEFSFSARSVAAAALNFALFAVFAIPASLALHFYPVESTPHRGPGIRRELRRDFPVCRPTGGIVLPGVRANADLE